MERRIILWIGIGILFVAVLFLIFKVSTLTGNTSGGEIDTTGWTANEVMNYEMHGTIPVRATGRGSASTGSSGGMVGGC